MERFKELAMLVIGSFLFAIGVNYFSIPNNLSEGGVIGITIVLYYMFGWSPGTVNLVANAILLVIGYRYFNRKTMVYTIIGIVVSSIFLYVTEGMMGAAHSDTLLAALFAGLFVGVGLGLMFRAGGTSGGSAILAQLAHQYLGWSISKGILIIDVVVIAGSYFIIGQEKAMYTLVAVYVGARVMDYVIEGLNHRTAVTIISAQPHKIREHIMLKMARGVTVMEGRGGYTEQKKEILYVVINKPELVKLKNVVAEADEQAFVVIHDVRDVLGSGFQKNAT
ncbi:DUF2179 domain-containing protein [Planococcaceae bacterium Storch 2/2-2]|nr:DUF2179 domain-containing protein [Planococcaceae bacterium Storch 2/2-2]